MVSETTPMVLAGGHSTRWLRQSALLKVLEAADVDNRVRSAATTIYQALIEAELTAVIGAGPHERTDARSDQRNGSRPRILATTAGHLEPRIGEAARRLVLPFPAGAPAADR